MEKENKIEIFKDIPNYEGIYQVSNLGNVKSLPREIWNGKVFYISKEMILKQGFDKYGYPVVSINSKPKKVHQLLAMAFLNHKPCGLKLVVDHIDNNPLNNNLNNLQIVTTRENLSKDKKNGTSKYVGVSWSRGMKKWLSCIFLNGSIKVLGYFEDELEASKTYDNFLRTI